MNGLLIIGMLLPLNAQTRGFAESVKEEKCIGN